MYIYFQYWTAIENRYTTYYQKWKQNGYPYRLQSETEQHVWEERKWRRTGKKLNIYSKGNPFKITKFWFPYNLARWYESRRKRRIEWTGEGKDGRKVGLSFLYLYHWRQTDDYDCKVDKRFSFLRINRQKSFRKWTLFTQRFGLLVLLDCVEVKGVRYRDFFIYRKEFYRKGFSPTEIFILLT